MRALLGPLAVAIPYAVAWLAGTRMSAGTLTLAAVAFFLILRLRAYAAPVFARARAVDWWVFNLSLYLPLILFATRTDLRVGVIVYPVAMATYLIVVCGYLTWYVLLWWAGAAINLGKLLYGLAVVPVHMAAFVALASFGPGPPLLAAAMIGIVMEHYYWRLGDARRERDVKVR